MKIISGQASNYACTANTDVDVEFTLSSGYHSAWNPTLNCALSECTVNSTINRSCRSNSTHCFSYQLINNRSICVPPIDCSILQPCDNITRQCQSSSFVCVIDSCCSAQTVCIPWAFTTICRSSTDYILWTMDNTLDDINQDYIGNGLNSPSYILGINGYSLVLTLNQCVVISSYLNMSYQSFTWEFWIYLTANLPYATLIGQCSNTGIPDECLEFNIINNTMQLVGVQDDVISNTSLSLNSWYHVAFIFNIPDNKKYIYLNGLLDTVQNSTGSLRASSTVMTFGCLTTNNGSSYTNYFTGYLDQILYTPRAKTSTELLDDATLVLYYPFRSSEPLLDSGPNNIIATFNTIATISSGVADQAIYLNTNTSYFRATNLVRLGTSDWPFSLAFWYKRDVSTINVPLIRLSTTLTGNGGWCPLYFALDNSGALGVSFRVRVSFLYTMNGISITAGTWYHFALTFSATNGFILYANGVSYDSYLASTFFSDSAQMLTIGDTGLDSLCGYAPSGQLSGSFDEFRLYSREITSAEVSQLYSNP